MRILHVYDPIFPFGGGSQIAVLNWLKNLIKTNLEVKLLANKNSSSVIDKELLKILIPADYLNLNCFFPGFCLSYLNKNTKKEVEKFSPQIIHFHEPSLLAAQTIKFAHSLGIKTIVTFHTNFGYAKGKTKNSFLFAVNSIAKKFQLSLLQKSDYITTPSEVFQTSLQQKFNKKVFYLPHPISSFFFLENNLREKKEGRVKNLITVSRLSPEKNIDILIDAMKYLKQSFFLTIIGEGIDKKRLQEKTKKLNLQNNIRFFGWVKNENLPLLFGNHGLFVSASDFETFGIVCVEALASGLPCVVLDCPVSREVIPNNMAIFVKNLQPQEWAKKIEELSDNPSLYEMLKENISKDYGFLRQYKEQESTQRLVEIYKEITAE